MIEKLLHVMDCVEDLLIHDFTFVGSIDIGQAVCIFFDIPRVQTCLDFTVYTITKVKLYIWWLLCLCMRIPTF